MDKKIGKIVILAIAATLLLPTLAPAHLISEEKKTGINIENFEVKASITFSEKELVFEKVMGYDIIRLQDEGQLCESGKPMLPLKNIMIALPEGMEATNIRIINVKEKIIPGAYKIFPAQLPQTLDTSVKELEFVQCDTQVYESYYPYPSKLVELTQQNDLAGQGIVTITVYPIHYIPRLKMVKLLTSIELVIEGIDGYVCGDYLPHQISEGGKFTYQKIIENMVENPDEVELKYEDKILHSNFESNDYDYVIITTTSWVDDFQTLADWKTKKGIPAKIVTTDWIYSNENYSGSNIEKIRDFIQDAHTNWGTIYFLLGADTNNIPYSTESFYINSQWYSVRGCQV